MFDSVMIASQGEIARRIACTARRMGIRVSAVYSSADEDLPYVQGADKAVCLGEPAPGLSYLNCQRLLEVARQSGAAAVHPGAAAS